MISTARGLRTGDLVTVPAGDGRREVVVESVSWDGARFAGAMGGTWPAGVAELVPLPVAAGALAK